MGKNEEEARWGYTPQRKDIERVFHQYGAVVHASLRPLPTQTGDGTYIEHKVPSTLWNDFKSLGLGDFDTILKMVKSKLLGDPLDDKKYLMEKVIQLASALPDRSDKRTQLTRAFIDDLWTSLEHPPVSYLGQQYIYRQSDGSMNNIMYPHLGAANTPYARSVKPKTIRPASLPDPGVIFDSLLARKEYQSHPGQLSSMLFYLASIIIHDLFHTSHDREDGYSISKTSSYLDLAPLYGSNEEDQKSLRTFHDGKIKPDSFCEKRLLGFPPGVGCLLIMFNRFHNYIVEQLAIINEGGRFTKPADAAKRSKYDEDLFQTGRLITCGLYINIILLDYVRTIINLNRTDSAWNLDPRADASVFGKRGTPEGIGNQVSAEFNLVYRWHSCISNRDDKWTRDLYKELFPGQDPEKVSQREFLARLEKMEQDIPKDPSKRPLAHLSRGPNGSFDDDELVKILAESIEDPAGAFGAHHTPPVLRHVEILGILQSRAWNVCSLNEFREFFGLKKHETFEDINPEPEVADQLRHLYDHPDYVELYPGIIVESTKDTMVPGSGLATNFTISRAVLSDAVTLVRADRFYTVDYHPRNLTNWGYNEVQYDLSIEQGCVFYKLFLRVFPQHFKANSVYAHYPLTTPAENNKILTNLGKIDQYDFERPGRMRETAHVSSYAAAKEILDNQQDFKVTWGEGLEAQIGAIGRSFMLSGDESVHTKSRLVMSPALYRSHWQKEVKEFYEDMTLELLQKKSYQLAGTSTVDIVRDVGNIAQAHFAANIFALPLKTEKNPFGIYTERELYMVLTVMFIRVFFNLDRVKEFPLTQAAKTLATQLGKLVEVNVEAVNVTGWLTGMIERLHEPHTALTGYGRHMIQMLLRTGMSSHDIAWGQILPSAAAMVANQGQVFAQIVDYYLSDDGKVHLPEINRLSKLDTADAEDKLLHYAMEGIRIAGAFGSYREVKNKISVEDHGKVLEFEPGEKILISFVQYAKDPKAFPEPNKVRLDRPLDSYLHYGTGPHRCLGKEISQVAVTAMLKTVGKLENLRRVPGPQGHLKRIPREGGFVIYMKEDGSDYFPFPTTMKVQWDGELPPTRGSNFSGMNGGCNGVHH
ncbi:MAG: hypothetical protein M1817_002563 [Caeruleum heppii]|nr:MAG: hypothetical protein M1817_002563 [Caeruleum heppii]